MVPADADSSTLSVFYDDVILEHSPLYGAFDRPPATAWIDDTVRAHAEHWRVGD